MNRHTRQNQTGAVLIVALLVLLVLTILGVVSLNNMTLEERMAANFSSAETGFQTAESAIKAVVFDGSRKVSSTTTPGTYVTNTAYVEDHDPFKAGMETCKTANEVTPQSDLDPGDKLAHQSVSVETKLTYQGWSTSAICVARGEELGGDSGCATFEIESTVGVGSGSHQSATTHVQLVTMMVPLGTGAPCEL